MGAYYNLLLLFSLFQISRALQFLHDLGTVQYFDNESLSDHVVINPQWIVDVMKCVVSVKDSNILVRSYGICNFCEIFSQIQTVFFQVYLCFLYPIFHNRIALSE